MSISILDAQNGARGFVDQNNDRLVLGDLSVELINGELSNTAIIRAATHRDRPSAV
jgi:hypothetical protein